VAHVRAGIALIVALIAAVVSDGTASALDDPSIQVQLVSSPEAISLLNQARAANGIPGDLAEDQELSQGCSEYLNDYEPAPGQYPHEEIPSQPGYTPGGAAAVSQSDLSGRSWESNGTSKYGLQWWTSQFNPWSNAPLHLTSLFDPGATTAWYAEDHSGACMGTSYSQRQFAEPSFFSYPGSGSTNVPIAQRASEEPWTPQAAAGIPENQTTGPNMILYPEGLQEPRLLEVTLATAGGEPVPVAVANPASPEPTPNSSNFPTGYTVGEYSRGAGFAIPPQPLAANTAFVLTAHWENEATAAQYTQTVDFSTGAQTLEQMLPRLPTLQPVVVPSYSHGTTFTQSSTQPLGSSSGAGEDLAISMILGLGKATFTAPGAAGLAAAVTIHVQQIACTRYGRCRGRTLRTIHRQVTITGSKTRFSLPHTRRGQRVEVRVTVPAFTHEGLSYEKTSITGIAP
jgi:hypothetical protein